LATGRVNVRAAGHLSFMEIRRVVADLHESDPALSKRFYESLFGFESVMDHGWIVTLAAPGNPETQITLIRQDATAPVNPDLSIEVDDVDQAYAAAQQMGCEIVYPVTDEPWGVRRFFVRDPGGKVVNVLSHA
jgi:predicted enzyme related to lactoylglutathione lyase